MRSFKALIEHLDSLALYDHDQLDSWVDEGALQWRNTPIDAFSDVRILYTMPYTAVMSIHDFTGSSQALFFHLLNWLVEHCYDFDKLDFPDFDVEMLAEGKADIEITLRFEDDVLAREDVDGDVQFKGKRYTIIDSYTPAVAEELAGIETEPACN